MHVNTYLSPEFHGFQSSVERQITASQQRLGKPKAMDQQPGSGKTRHGQNLGRQQGSRVLTRMRSSLELNCDTRWFLPLRSVIETWRWPLAKRWALLGRIVSIPCLEKEASVGLIDKMSKSLHRTISQCLTNRSTDAFSNAFGEKWLGNGLIHTSQEKSWNWLPSNPTLFEKFSDI